jgi:maleylacetate reductase
MDPFGYKTFAQEINFAPGGLAQLGEAVSRSGWQRLVLCANHSMQMAGQVESVRSVLGDRLVAVCASVLPHVQDIQLNQIFDLAVENRADAIIGMGGGSPIGMAKAVASRLNETQSTAIPVIAIPTTYAGSEMTPVYGITHTNESPPRKLTVNDPRIAPKLVVYDPDLTLDLSPELTGSTGINALAHCIEALYSKTRNPLSSAAAKEGVRHIHHSLLRCYQDGKDPDARSEMLLGAHLAGLALASVTMGLHHGLCHVLGGSANVPHGIANAIVLPYAIRFNADASAPQLIPAAEAMGLPTEDTRQIDIVAALIREISELIHRLNLPQRLREVGVGESDLPDLARIALQNRTIQNNPRPVTDVNQLQQLLRDAW